MKSKNLFWIFALVLMMSFAQADIIVDKSTNEFSLSSPSLGGKVCSCASFQMPATIENVGDIDAVFHLDVEADQNWYYPDKDSIYLESGEAGTFNVMADVPCGWTGVSDFTVVVDSTYGREKRLARNIQVVHCQNIMIEEGVTSNIVDPNEVATYDFTIENSASFADTYRINVGKFGDYIRLSENNFELGPGEKRQIFVYSRFPADRFGDFNIPLTVRSVKNEMEQSLNLRLRIRKAYGFSIQAENQLMACSKVQDTIPVTIQNNAKVSNQYDLSFNGPGFVDFNARTVSLQPNTSQTFNLDISPEDADIGSYDIVIRGNSRIGDVTAEKIIGLEVRNCYDHVVTMPEELVMVCGENETIYANVRNNGLYEEDFVLSLGAPVWAELSSRLLELNPSENKDVGVGLNPVCADAEYQIDVSAANRDRPEIRSSDSTTLRIYTPESAHMLNFPKRNFDIKYGQEFLDIEIINEGVRRGRYNISIDSPFLSLERQSLTLDAGESGNLRFRIGDISGLEPGEYLHDLVFNLRDSNVKYEMTIGTNLLGPNVFESFGAWFYNAFIGSGWYKLGWCGWSGVLLMIILILLIIVGVLAYEGTIETKRFPAEYREHFAFLMSGMVLIFLVAIVFFAISYQGDAAAFYEEPSLNFSPLHHEFRQDSTYELDLEIYFSDPDGDPLTYDYRGAGNIQVNIRNGNARIDPLDGWAGQEKITFIAIDPAGARNESKPFTFNVLERKDVTWREMWLENCEEFNALIVGFIFLALFYLAYLVKPESKSKKKGKK